MDVHYKVFIEQSVLDAMQSTRGKNRKSLKAFLQSLAIHPFEEGDYSELDPEGRTVHIKVIGNHSVGFYADHAVKEIKVFEFLPADVVKG